MKKIPLITIGITCFNCEKTIERALDSALKQNWKNKEIILIDDCSTDNSKKILLKYKAKFPKIKIIFNKKNRGLAYNENLIIKISKGKFLAFFDGDDKSRYDRITKQYKKFIEYKSKKSLDKIFVYSNRNIISNIVNKNKIISYGIGRKSPEPYGKIVAKYLLKIKLKNNNLCWGSFGSGTMFTKTTNLKKLNGFDESFKRGAEVDLWIRSAFDDYHFISVNETLMTQYISHDIDKKIKKDLLSRLKLIKKYKKYLDKNNLYTSSLFNFYAWYWFQNKNKIFAYIFKILSVLFSLNQRNLKL